MIAAAYLYWPVVYFAVFLPFIVPRLPARDYVPAVIAAGAIAGYLGVLLLAGRHLDHRRIALHSLGMAVSVDVFAFGVSALRMHSFPTALDRGVDPWDGLAMIVNVVVVLACLEAGRALGRLTRPRCASAPRASSRRNAA